MDVNLEKVDRSQVKAFFKFDLLVLPTLVKVGFIVGIIGILLAGISAPFKAALFLGRFDFGAFVVGCVISAIMVPLGLIWLRILCESMIVVFKIREDLRALLGDKAPAPSEPAKSEPPKPEAPPSEPPKS